MSREPNRLVDEISADVGDGLSVYVSQFTTSDPDTSRQLVAIFDVEDNLVVALSVDQARAMESAIGEAAAAVARSQLALVQGGR